MFLFQNLMLILFQNATRKYSESNYRDDPNSNYYEESEPEWISYGPKSQSDTIELGG